jgi:hypothetical protein
MDIACRIYIQIQLVWRNIVGIERMGFVRCPAKLNYWQTKENMAHRRIADDRHFVDVVRLNVGFFAELFSQVVYAIDYGFVKLGEFFIGLSVCDSADNIVAEACLGIQGGFGSLTLTGGHINESGYDCGCAEIDGQAENHAGWALLQILLVDVGSNLPCGVNTFGKNPLLEISRCGGDCDQKVTFDSVLTCEDLPRARLKIDEALFARTCAAANGVQNNAGLASSLDERGTGMN